MACQSQYAYAKLLRKEGLGDGLYYPTRIAKLGDVAYFSGTTYHTRFNVFTLDEETASRLGIRRFHLDDSSREGHKYNQIFSSARTQIVDLTSEAEGTLGPTEFAVKIEKREVESDVAVCIPSKPLNVVALRGEDVDWQLRTWWEEWRHNIACACGSIIEDNPVFNCYYKGTEAETSLHLKGNLVDRARISFEAGFMCEEIGNFGFKQCPVEEGGKWSIFIQKLDLKLFRFRKLKAQIKGLFHQLVKKQQVTKRPNWRYPGQVQGEFKKSSDSKPAEENTRNQTSGQISYCPSENCVESFGVSEILTLVRTPDDEYFGEFHGPNLPDEVVLGNEAICEEYAMEQIRESGLLSQTDDTNFSASELRRRSFETETSEGGLPKSNFKTGNTYVKPLLSPSAKEFSRPMSQLMTLMENTTLYEGVKMATITMDCQTQ